MVSIVEVESLLPNNSTDFERALEAALAQATQLSVLPIRQLRQAPSAEVVPYLLWEYGLGEIAAFIDEPLTLIEQGLLWQQERGTPAAIKRVLGWLNQTAQIEQEDGKHWFEVQLGLAQVLSFEQASAIIQLVKMSLPVRSQLKRLHAGWDVRRMILSEQSLDDSLLSDWSGIEKNGITLSFGEQQQAAITAKVHATTARQGIYATAAKRCDLATLDFSQFGETALINHKVLSGAIQGFGLKSSQAYAGLGFLGFSQDAMILSESGLSESWITPRYFKAAEKVSLDEMRLNEPLCGKWQVLDQIIDQKQSTHTQPTTPKTHSRQCSDITVGFKEGTDWALDTPRPLSSVSVQQSTQGIEGHYQGRLWQNRWSGQAQQPWQIGSRHIEIEGYGVAKTHPTLAHALREDVQADTLTATITTQSLTESVQTVSTTRQGRAWHSGWVKGWQTDSIIGERDVSTHTIG